MLSKILKKLLPNNAATSKVIASSENVSQLHLMYKDLKIGKLEFIDSKWVFSYTEGFKNQSVIKELLEFPDVNKVYKSEVLWPFFANRIPSNTQPKIQEYFKNNPENSKNWMDLLAKFGFKSTNNPYLLLPN